MFDKIKDRIGKLERETEQLKAELAEVKRTFSQVLGENAGLRAENDRLIKLGIAPAYPRGHTAPMARTPYRIKAPANAHIRRERSFDRFRG
jgi:regulator of replication initiation timing